jgi:hypothetical protein
MAFEAMILISTPEADEFMRCSGVVRFDRHHAFDLPVDTSVQISGCKKLKLAICVRRGPARRWVEFFAKPISVWFSVPPRLMLNLKTTVSQSAQRILQESSSHIAVPPSDPGGPAAITRVHCFQIVL